MEKPENSPNANKEISLKDIILTIGEWRRYLLSKWLVIGIVVLIGAGLGLTYSLMNKPSYIGELTFVVEESKSSGLGSYAGIANQLGIDLGGGGNGMGVFTGENIIEFLKSRLMIQKVLLSPVIVNQKSITLADYYIDIYNLRPRWAKERPELKDIHFPVNSDRKNFTLHQDSILMDMQEKIVKTSLRVTKPDLKLSFISVKVTSPTEIFSKVFVETLVRVAADFYIETKTKRSKVNMDKLQATADSLGKLLNRKTYALAETQDLNVNPIRQVAGVSTELQARDKLMLQTMYGEVVKNLEISKITMMQETPIIQIVDTPILPLKKKRVGKMMGMIGGGALFGFLIVMMLVARKLYRDILNE